MRQAETFSELYEQVAARKVPFILVFFGLVILSYGVLFAIDFIPEPVTSAPARSGTAIINEVRNAITRPNGGLSPQREPEETTGGMRVVIPENTAAEAEAEVVEEDPEPEPVSVVDPAALPVQITFDSLDRTVTVLNPTSRSIEALDTALLSGVVRHPDSATFSNPGNMFILGHSSYLPNVLNKNFQAFNGLQNLTWGDTIRVASADTEYVYRVDRVYKAKASEVQVPVTTGEAKLTLATCNSFGSKEDRFIVEASLVRQNVL